MSYFIVPEVRFAVFNKKEPYSLCKYLLPNQGHWIGQTSKFWDWLKDHKFTTFCLWQIQNRLWLFLMELFKGTVCIRNVNIGENLKRIIEQKLLQITRHFFINSYESFVSVAAVHGPKIWAKDVFDYLFLWVKCHSFLVIPAVFL